MIWFAKNLIVTRAAVRAIVPNRSAGWEACCLDLLHAFLPQVKDLHVDSVSSDNGGVMLTARARGMRADCRACEATSGRVHSRYRRCLREAGCGGRPVTVDLEVRRFFCLNPACDVVTFVEQVPGLTQWNQRRTPLLRGLLEAIALALAGRAGSRLADAFGITVSRSTLIRLIRALPDPEIGQITVLGVDEFAKRRGHSYATLLIDMGTHRPVDVLDDRTADAFARWLREHPGIEVICRDRAGSYAEGAKKGAPEAIEVADRFHLWQNLCDAAETTIRAHRADLREPETEVAAPATKEEPAAVPVAPESRTAVRTRERHAAIHGLLDDGRTHTEICKILGLADRTVRKFRLAGTAEELLNGPRQTGRQIDRYGPYLHKRWNEGVHDAAQLHTEITAQGYQGSKRSVRRFVLPLRPYQRVVELPPTPPTVREATRWVTSHPDHLTTDETTKLSQLKDRSQPFARLAGHVTAFAQMMTNRTGTQHLEGWLTQIENDDFPALHSLARGLRRDQSAVTNGLTLTHSSGAVEGNVCRVKHLKRQMFGRANLDLLRKRILLTT
jgi:transposase